MADLRINFQATIGTGNSVISKGEEFGEVLEKINGINNDLKAYWEGQDASKYAQAVEEQAKVMKELEATIKEIGTFLTKAGNAYKEAMEANASGIKL